MTGLICYGPHQTKQLSFVLLDEWVPQSRSLNRDDALAKLTKRYFTSHGPATVPDFVWWSGLTVREARAGIESVRQGLLAEVIDGVTYWLSPATPDGRDASGPLRLLPPFDEYTVAYKDRSAVLAPQHAPLAASGGVFRPIIVVDGHVVGTWKTTLRKGSVVVMPSPFDKQDLDRNAFYQAATRYAEFLRKPLAGE